MDRNKNQDQAVNYAGPGSVVGIQCNGSINDTVVTGGGRWLAEDEEIDRDYIRSLNS